MGLFNFNKKVAPTPQPVDVPNTFFDVIQMRGIDIPMPKETKGQDWVLFGHNNQFPLDLLDYRNTSATHDSIIEGKTNLICGDGIMFAETREASNSWLVNNFKQVPFYLKLDKIFWMVTRDYLTFGYSCFEVVYSMDRTRIVDMNWIDASRIACGKRNEFGDIEEYYYSENWANWRQATPRKIDAFSPAEATELDENGQFDNGGRQLVFIKNNDNNMDYYSLPNYFSALKWIKADGLMAEYNLAAIQNGFSPSIVFNFFKKPTPEERRMNTEAINARHGGPKNAGKAMVFYSDGKDAAPEVKTLDATNIDQRLLTVADQITQQIITAHRTHPALCGIPTGAKLGISTELLQSFEIMNTMVIKPERKQVLDAFKSALLYNGIIKVEVEEISPIKIIN